MQVPCMPQLEPEFLYFYLTLLTATMAGFVYAYAATIACSRADPIRVYAGRDRRWVQSWTSKITCTQAMQRSQLRRVWRAFWAYMRLAPHQVAVTECCSLFVLYLFFPSFVVLYRHAARTLY